MAKANELTEGSIGKALLKFALPFLLSNFLQALYGAADLFVVGRYSGAAAVSAVAIGSQVMQTVTGAVLGFAMGSTVLIGRMIGKRDDRGAARAVGTTAVLFLIAAAALTPLMIAGTDTFVWLMDTPEEAVSAARRYIFTCACGLPFIIGYNAVSAVFRGLGDSKTPTYFIAVACAVNVAGDFALAGGLGMGALGAAIATVAAQAISFFAALYYLWRRGFPFDFRRSDMRVDRASAKSIAVVGCPLALQDALVNISFLVITAIINGMGLVQSAAVGVVEKIIVFAMLPPSAFASAVATMTAQNMGADKPARALASLKCGVAFSLVFGVLFAAYCQFLPETVTGIFSKDADVVRAAGQYLRAYSFDCVMVAFVFNMNSYFSGLGKSVVSFVHSMIATFGVRIPATYVLSYYASRSLFVMGLAAPAASVLSVCVCAGYFVLLGKKSEKILLRPV